MEFGSFNNMISAQSTNGQPQPEVGMGVTVLMWSDRRAGTITRISKSGKAFWYTDDTAVRTDNNGMSECQRYEYTSNPDGVETEVRLNRKGAWREKGQGHYIQLGCRRAYHDFSF